MVQNIITIYFLRMDIFFVNNRNVILAVSIINYLPVNCILNLNLNLK